jgi:ATP-dependent RNA/DNA helicase IGHMBP2
VLVIADWCVSFLRDLSLRNIPVTEERISIMDDDDIDDILSNVLDDDDEPQRPLISKKNDAPIARLLCRYELDRNLFQDKCDRFIRAFPGQPHLAKVTSTEKSVDLNNRDASKVCGIHNVSLSFERASGGTIVLYGYFSAFQKPFGALLTIRNIRLMDTSFDQALGVPLDIEFSLNNSSNLDETQRIYTAIVNDDRFLFKISQFDDFMKIFGYYKQLADELNNNFSYPLSNVSQPYQVLPVSVKGYTPNERNGITDEEGVLVGYRLSPADSYGLKEEVRDQIESFVDISLHEPTDILRKIMRQKSDGNLYLSEKATLDETSLLKARPFEAIKVVRDGEYYKLTGRVHGLLGQPRYLNAYDMGQRIKLDSIDRSLKLIKAGGTSSAAELLSYLIGDTPIPNVTGKAILHTPGQKHGSIITHYTKSLNDSQIEAFLKAIDGSPVTVIKGPPGTGKTFVINAIVQYVTKVLNEKVIISSQTHVAIDNVLDELMTNNDMVIPNRITNKDNPYSRENLDRTIFRLWGRNFLKFNSAVPARSRTLANTIASDAGHFQGEPTLRYTEITEDEQYSVVGVTTTSAVLGGMHGQEILKGYDWLIIDEVSKCPITEVLRYLPYVKKLILVGDDFQLPPVMEFSKEDVQNLPGYDEVKFAQLVHVYESSVFASTLEKAKKSNRLVVLNENYRSVASVLKAYNIFYDYKLIGRREQVSPQKVGFNEAAQFYNDRDVFFVEVRNGKEMKEAGETSRYNVEEAKATAFFLQYLLDHVLSQSQVSVAAIFPYGAQIQYFTKKYRDLINQARQAFKSFDVNTVDAFQGKQADIVLVDTVVTDTSHGTFLKDFRRINVSMSRARDKLFIFGNSASLSSIEMSASTSGEPRHYFHDIIETIRHENGGYIIYTEKGVTYETQSDSAFDLK